MSSFHFWYVKIKATTVTSAEIFTSGIQLKGGFNRYPQWRHFFAESLTSFAHSGQLISAMIPLLLADHLTTDRQIKTEASRRQIDHL